MFFRPKKADGADARERALWGDLISLGTTFPIAIALGFFLGRWAGGKLGHPAVGQWIGLAWGVATAFWELYKTTKPWWRAHDFYKALEALRLTNGEQGQHSKQDLWHRSFLYHEGQDAFDNGPADACRVPRR